jgi:hypothetical protein
MEARIIIQNINTAWSKQSRGGKLASERNAVPEALLFPLEKPRKSAGGLIEHCLAYTEWEGFSTASYSSLIEEPAGKIRTGCVLIEPVGGELKVIFEYDTARAGMPIRYSPPGGKPSTRMRLQAGQWGRVLYNGRTASEETWWYDKVVINVGLFKTLREDVFVSTQPTQVISQMARLW